MTPKRGRVLRRDISSDGTSSEVDAEESNQWNPTPDKGHYNKLFSKTHGTLSADSAHSSERESDSPATTQVKVLVLTSSSEDSGGSCRVKTERRTLEANSSTPFTPMRIHPRLSILSSSSSIDDSDENISGGGNSSKGLLKCTSSQIPTKWRGSLVPKELDRWSQHNQEANEASKRYANDTGIDYGSTSDEFELEVMDVRRNDGQNSSSSHTLGRSFLSHGGGKATHGCEEESLPGTASEKGKKQLEPVILIKQSPSKPNQSPNRITSRDMGVHTSFGIPTWSESSSSDVGTRSGAKRVLSSNENDTENIGTEGEGANENGADESQKPINPYTAALSIRDQHRRIPAPSASRIKENLKNIHPPSSTETPTPHRNNKKIKRVSFSSPLISPDPLSAIRYESPSSQTATERRRWEGTQAPEDNPRETIVVLSSNDGSDLVTNDLPPQKPVLSPEDSFLRRVNLTPLVKKRKLRDDGDSSASEDVSIETPTPAPKLARIMTGVFVRGPNGGLEAETKADASSSPLKRKLKDVIDDQDERTGDEESSLGALGVNSGLGSEPADHDTIMVDSESEAVQALQLPEGGESQTARSNKKARIEEMSAPALPPSSHPRQPSRPSEFDPSRNIPDAISRLGGAINLVQEASESLNLLPERHQHNQTGAIQHFLESFSPPLETRFPSISNTTTTNNTSQTTITLDAETRKLYKKLRKEAKKLHKIADDIQPLKILQSSSVSLVKPLHPSSGSSTATTPLPAVDWHLLTAKLTLVVVNLRTTIDVWSKIMEKAYLQNVVGVLRRQPHNAEPEMAHSAAQDMATKTEEQCKTIKQELKAKKRERTEVEERLGRAGSEIGLWGTGSVGARERREKREGRGGNE